MKKLLIFTMILILFLIIIYPNNVSATATSLDQIMEGADDFIDAGGGEDDVDKTIDTDSLKDTSDFLYNILLGISMVIAVIVGMVLGIKYMTSTTEDKADIKETLPAYVISCVVVFGAFTIWKIIVNIIQ